MQHRVLLSLSLCCLFHASHGNDVFDTYNASVQGCAVLKALESTAQNITVSGAQVVCILLRSDAPRINAVIPLPGMGVLPPLPPLPCETTNDNFTCPALSGQIYRIDEEDKSYGYDIVLKVTPTAAVHTTVMISVESEAIPLPPPPRPISCSAAELNDNETLCTLSCRRVAHGAFLRMAYCREAGCGRVLGVAVASCSSGVEEIDFKEFNAARHKHSINRTDLTGSKVEPAAWIMFPTEKTFVIEATEPPEEPKMSGCIMSFGALFGAAAALSVVWLVLCTAYLLSPRGTSFETLKGPPVEV